MYLLGVQALNRSVVKSFAVPLVTPNVPFGHVSSHTSLSKLRYDG